VQTWAFGTMPAHHHSPYACVARGIPEAPHVLSASHPCVCGPHVLDCVRGQFDVSELAVSRPITGAGSRANTRARARTVARAGSDANTRARPITGARTNTRTRAGAATGRARLLRFNPRGRFHSRQPGLRARRAERHRRHDRDMDEHGLGGAHFHV
jgi:hypothetical protein